METYAVHGLCKNRRGDRAARDALQKEKTASKRGHRVISEEGIALVPGQELDADRLGLVLNGKTARDGFKIVRQQDYALLRKGG